MTRAEAMEILGAYRPGTEDDNDPFFAEALKLAHEDPELARWFAAEQAFDAAVTGKLEAEPAPFGLKTSLMAAALPSEPKPRFAWTWMQAVSLACSMACAAAAMAMIGTAMFMRHSTPPADMNEYRDEMVSFVDMPPTLPVLTDNMDQIRAHLADKTKISDIELPKGVMQLPALGCRSLMFRGHNVGLICFQRKDGKLVHVFMVNKSAFAASELPHGPHYRQEGEWGTTMWLTGDMVYLMATTGNEGTVNSFL